MWKRIEGYMWPYRINEEAQVQKLYRGEWVELKPQLSKGRTRAVVKMRTAENKPVNVPLVHLMADAFMGGRREGMCIIHKDGSKLNCRYWNLAFATRKEAGALARGGRSRPILKIAPDGEVVEIYPNARKAAKKEYISRHAIMARCNNEIQKPFDLTGYNYQYEDAPGRKKWGISKKGECV